MRAFTRALSAALALALLAIAVLAIVEVILAAADRDPWLVPHDEWLADLREATWRDDGVVIAGIILLVAGLLLLATQLVRRPPAWLRISGASPGSQSEVATRGVVQAVRDAATGVDGVSQARAHATRSGMKVAARTNRRTDDGLRDSVQSAVDGTLAPLHLEPAQPADVRVHRARD